MGFHFNVFVPFGLFELLILGVGAAILVGGVALLIKFLSQR